MAITFSWVTYTESSPFPVLNDSETLLEFGTYKTGCWGPTTASNTDPTQAIKLIVGLRFVGISATNIQVWLDTSYGSLFFQDGTIVQSVDFATRLGGYKFKYVVIGGSKLAFAQSSPVTDADIFSCAPDGSQLQTIVTDTENNYNGSPSYDGTKIAFISERNEEPRVHVMNADGSNITVISSPGGGYADATPVYSPATSSTTIAFSSNRTGGNWQLYWMTDSGGSLTNISNNAYNDTQPFFDPTGTYLVFVSDQSGRPQLWTCKASDGSSRTQITNVSGACSAPCWYVESSVGKIAFNATTSGNYQIYVCNSDGSGLIQLVYSTSNDTQPIASADDSVIYFIRDGNLYRVTYLGATLTQITNTSIGIANPRWSTASGGLIIVDGYSSANIRNIFALNPANIFEERLTFSGIDNYSASWSYDGTLGVMVSNRSGSDEVWTVDTQYTAVTQVTTEGAQCIDPSLSPDKTKVVYSCNVGGTFNLYTKNADGSGSHTQITSGSWNDLSPVWHPTSNLIIFSSNRSGTYQLYTCANDGTGLTQFITDSYSDTEPRWSYDGNHVLFGQDQFTSTGRIHVIVNSSGGSPAYHQSSTGYEEYQGSWAPNGLSINYLRSPINNPSQATLFNIAYPLPGSVEGGFQINSAPTGLLTRPWAASNQNVTYASEDVNNVKELSVIQFGYTSPTMVPMSNTFIEETGGSGPYLASPAFVRLNHDGTLVSGHLLVVPTGLDSFVADQALISPTTTSATVLYLNTLALYNDQISLQTGNGKIVYSGSRDGIWTNTIGATVADTQLLGSPENGELCRLFDVASDLNTILFGVGANIYSYVISTTTLTLVHTAPGTVVSATTYLGSAATVTYIANNKLYRSLTATTYTELQLSDILAAHGSTNYEANNRCWFVNEGPGPSYDLAISSVYVAAPATSTHSLSIYDQSANHLLTLETWASLNVSSAYFGAPRWRRIGASEYGASFCIAFAIEGDVSSDVPYSKRVDFDISGTVHQTIQTITGYRFPAFLDDTPTYPTNDLLVSGTYSSESDASLNKALYILSVTTAGSGYLYVPSTYGQISNPLVHLGWVCWKPDGTEIAYVAANVNTNTAQIISNNPTLTSASVLANFTLPVGLWNNIYCPTGLDWGTSKIVYVRALTSGGAQQILTMNIDGSSPDTVLIANTNTSVMFYSPRYNAAGTQLIYITTTASGGSLFACELVLYTISGSVTTVLDIFNLPFGDGGVSSYVTDISCAWSEDESYAVYITDPTVSAYAQAINVTTGQKFQMNFPVWSYPHYESNETSFSFDVAKTAPMAVTAATGYYATYTLEYIAPAFNGSYVVTTMTNDDVNASFNPASTKIIFDNNELGRRQLYIMNADGSGKQILQSNAYDEYSPSPSPDGTKIAYISKRSTSGVDDGENVWIADINYTSGALSSQTQLTKLSQQDNSPCWSSDSNTVYFVGPGRGTPFGTVNVFSVGASTGENTGIATLILEGVYANPSVVGTHIAVEVVNSSALQNTIYRYLISNTTTSNFVAYGFNPAISPDGTQIAYNTYNPTSLISSATGPLPNWIFRSPAGGGSATQVTQSGPQDVQPTWRADGNLLLFSSNRNDNEFEVYSVEPSGVVAAFLTEDTVNDYSPAWTRDGSKIAFVSDRTGNKQVRTITVGNPPSIDVSNNSYTDQDPTWSHDASIIVFASNRNNALYLNLYSMTSSGGSPTALETLSSQNSQPSCHPTSDLIVFSSNRSGKYQLYTLSISGGSATRLRTSFGNDTQPSWSQDGTLITFISDQSGVTQVYMMNADGTGAARVTQHSIPCSSPSWSPDNTQIAYTRNPTSGIPSVYVTDLTGTDDSLIVSNAFDVAWSSATSSADTLASHPSTWADLPISPTNAIDLGNADMTIDGEAFSAMLALAIYVPADESNTNVRGMRLGCSFSPAI